MTEPNIDFSVKRDIRVDNLETAESNTIPVLPANPNVVEGGIFFDSTTDELKFSDGLV